MIIVDDNNNTVVTSSIDLENELLEVFGSNFQPNDTRTIPEWCADNVSLGSGYSITGKFDVSISPHFIKIFEAIQDPYVREVSVLAPPRSGKTMIFELTLLHTIANGSGDILWLQLSDEKANQMADLRMIPLLKSCKPVSELLDLNNKYNITDSRFKFLHSTVHVTSPKENALNAVGYKVCFCDEVWRYKGDSILKEIKRRTDDYKGVSKCFFFSQGGIKGGAWYDQFHSGEVYTYGWCCPKCKVLQTFEWSKQREDKTYSGIVWPNNSSTKDDTGKWRITECAKQAVLECHHCRYQVTDNPQNRKYLLDSGDYIKTQDGDTSVKAFRFTNLCNVKMSFGEMVTRYLIAKQKKDFFGSTSDLENFHTKDMANFWDEYERNTRVRIKLGSYDNDKPFGEFEAHRFMTVDVQHKEFYYVVRAWTSNGESRLVAFGTCNTWKELDAIRERNKVDYRFTFVDSGEGKMTETIYGECLKHGRWAIIDGEEIWACYNSTKGSGEKGWRHSDNKFYRYKEPTEYTVGSEHEEDVGKFLTHITFSSFRYSQILMALRDGKGKKWEAVDVTDEYTNHLNSTVLQRKLRGNTADWEYVSKPNTPEHFWDCEKLQCLAADLLGCLNVGESVVEPETPTNISK